MKPLKDRLKRCEGEIQQLEASIRQREAQLADPLFYEKGEEAAKAGAELKDLRKRLELVMIEWESVGMELQEKDRKWKVESGE
jgi:predicted hydrocarbon binding protein